MQHMDVKCNIQILILGNKIMYFGDFVVLVPYISIEYIFDYQTLYGFNIKIT